MSEIRYEPRLSEKVELLARAHVNHYDFHSLYDFTDSRNYEDYSGTWLGAEARIVYHPLPWLRLTAGGEAQYHPDVTLEGRSESAAETSTYLNEHSPYQFGAGYALLEGSPVKWLRFSGGARVDVYSTFGPIVVPRAALIFKPGDGNVLKIMGGRAVRAPSIYEQVYNDSGISQVRAVDPARGLKLGPESIYSGEIEYTRHFLEDWTALAAIHASYVEGIMTSVPDAPGSPVVRYANSTSPAFIAGGDIEVRREWRRGLLLAASYGYQSTRFLDASLPNPRLVNTPEHYASFRTVAPVIKELASFGLRFTVEAPRRIREDESTTTSLALLADATISGVVRDLGVRYVAGVYNIADRRYEIPVADTFQTRTLPQNGRTFLVDAIWTWP